MYSYLKFVVYDKLLKHRQSFWITLYVLRGLWARTRELNCYYYYYLFIYSRKVKQEINNYNELFWNNIV